MRRASMKLPSSVVPENIPMHSRDPAGRRIRVALHSTQSQSLCSQDLFAKGSVDAMQSHRTGMTVVYEVQRAWRAEDKFEKLGCVTVQCMLRRLPRGVRSSRESPAIEKDLSGAHSMLRVGLSVQSNTLSSVRPAGTAHSET